MDEANQCGIGGVEWFYLFFTNFLKVGIICETSAEYVHGCQFCRLLKSQVLVNFQKIILTRLVIKSSGCEVFCQSAAWKGYDLRCCAINLTKPK